MRALTSELGLSEQQAREITQYTHNSTSVMWRSCGCSADCVITDNCCADAETNTEVGLKSYFWVSTPVGPYPVFWEDGNIMLWRKWRHIFCQPEKLKTGYFSKISTREGWRMEKIIVGEDSALKHEYLTVNFGWLDPHQWKVKPSGPFEIKHRYISGATPSKLWSMCIRNRSVNSPTRFKFTRKFVFLYWQKLKSTLSGGLLWWDRA